MSKPSENPLWWLDLPDELVNLPQWVNANDGEKVPMCSRSGRWASSSDPTTWSGFWDAQSAILSGKFPWAGFVFADNGLVGIDIDVGYEGEALSPTAEHILTLCHSYTERSRSGRGFHIILRGELPFTGRNNLAGVEIYKSKRYFIMTGDVLGGWTEIIENQAAIDEIVDKYFQPVRRSQDKPETAKIYCPEWPLPCASLIRVRPNYPPITEGGRNVSLASLAGCLHGAGYPADAIYQELSEVNQQACTPPLPEGEVWAIVKSITRYEK